MPNFVQWLLPREEKFFQMLKDQSFNVVNGANEFKNLVHNYGKLNYSRKKEAVRKIKSIEHIGDNLTHKIISILDKTFITPIDKEDIHRLTILLDDIIDLIYATSERMIIFRLNLMDNYIKKFTELMLETVKTMDRGILHLSKLKNMREFYVKIHSLEYRGDELYYSALAGLFSKKDVIEIIKYKEVYEFLENIIDKCEDIANVIESVVVKHA